jgi:hypothetical protein
MAEERDQQPDENSEVPPQPDENDGDDLVTDEGVNEGTADVAEE